MAGTASGWTLTPSARASRASAPPSGQASKGSKRRRSRAAIKGSRQLSGPPTSPIVLANRTRATSGTPGRDLEAEAEGRGPHEGRGARGEGLDAIGGGVEPPPPRPAVAARATRAPQPLDQARGKAVEAEGGNGVAHLEHGEARPLQEARERARVQE